MSNARLLGNGRYHGNRIMAATSGTRWDATTQVSSKSVHWWASYSFLSFFLFRGGTRSLRMSELRPASQAGPVRNPREGTSVMGKRWDATTQVSSRSVHCWASYSISNIFQYGGCPPSWILKIFIFGHVTVIEFQMCRCVPNFIKIG